MFDAVDDDMDDVAPFFRNGTAILQASAYVIIIFCFAPTASSL
jgi:hypothetical protein